MVTRESLQFSLNFEYYMTVTFAQSATFRPVSSSFSTLGVTGGDFPGGVWSVLGGPPGAASRVYFRCWPDPARSGCNQLQITREHSYRKSGPGGALSLSLSLSLSLRRNANYAE